MAKKKIVVSSNVGKAAKNPFIYHWWGCQTVYSHSAKGLAVAFKIINGLP